MWRLILSQLLARRFRLLLTLFAVVLGVTFVTGSLVLTDTSQRVFDEQFKDATAQVDLSVRDAVAFDSAMGVEVERDPLAPEVRQRVGSVPGVGSTRAVAKGQGLLEVDGEPVVPSGPSMLSSWAPPPFGAFVLRSGHAPHQPGEVVIDAATARDHGVRIGDSVTVRADRSERLTVVGLVGFGDQPGLPNTTVALTKMGTAQRLLDLDRGVSEVLVVADEDVPVAQLRDRIGEALGASYDVASSRDTAAASAEAAKTSLSYVQIMLFGLAGAALLVGGFLIANTFSIVVTQRTRELALLRATGATGRQVMGSVLAEAMVLGVVASVLGTVLGVAAALALRGLVGAFGVPLPSGETVVSLRTLLVALLVGVLVTVISAFGPARRASRVAPVEAMRQSAAGSVPTGRTRVVAGVLSAALAAAGCVVSWAGAGSGMLVAVAAVCAVVALTLLGPVLAPGLARVVGLPMRRAGLAGRLAGESAARAPRRTAATATALALSLALVTFMSIVASSVNASVRESYEEVITADLVVESARGEMLGGLSPEVYRTVAALPEVAVASKLRYGHWKDGTATRALTALDPATLPDVASVDMAAGSLAGLADAGGPGSAGIVLAEHEAAERGLSVGDELSMTFARAGVQQLRVVGLIEDTDAQALSTEYLISLDTFARLFTEKVDASVFVTIKDGVDAEQARTALVDALADQPTAEVRDQASAVAARTAMMDQILGLVTLLLLLAVLIAALGITNTLALSIVERTREIGLLRAVGMSRGQLRWMVRAEAVLVAAIAVVVGVALGTGFGAAMVAALGENVDAPLVLPLGRLALVVVVATAAGLVAGLLPARRAGRLEVLRAIGAE